MSKKSKLDKEKQKLISEIRRAQIDVETAEHFFQFVSDHELVDIAIYELEAKKSKYRYLLRMAKEKGIKRSLKESLIDAMAK